MIQALEYPANHSFARLKPLAFGRVAPKLNRIQRDVPCPGVCHTGIHQVCRTVAEPRR